MDIDELIQDMAVRCGRRAEELDAYSDEQMAELCAKRGIDIDALDTDEEAQASFAFGEMLRVMLTPAQFALLAGEPTPETIEATGLNGLAALGVLQGAATAAARRPELAEE